MRLALRGAVVCLMPLLIGAATLSAADAASGGMPTFVPKSAKPATETATPSEIQALLNLLADPKVQAWLEKQNKTEPAPAADKPSLEIPPTSHGHSC